MKPKEITAARRALNLTKAAFGKVLGVDRSTIHRWETGITVPPGNLLALACKQLNGDSVKRKGGPKPAH